MIAGFTGTQLGMTPEQQHTVRKLFEKIAVLHHGDCIGADGQAHSIARSLPHHVYIVGHPPVNNKKRAWCDFDEERNPLPYLVRDRRIAYETQLLIATPQQAYEVARSGTWATIRYAVEFRKPLYLVLPTGEIVHEIPRR